MSEFDFPIPSLELPEPEPATQEQATEVPEPEGDALVQMANKVLALALEQPDTEFGINLNVRDFFQLLTWLGRAKYAFQHYKRLPGKVVGDNADAENGLQLLDLQRVVRKLGTAHVLSD